MGEVFKVKSVAIALVISFAILVLTASTLLLNARAYAALPDRVQSLEVRVPLLEQELKQIRGELMDVKAANAREHAEIMGDVKVTREVVTRIERKLQ